MLICGIISAFIQTVALKPAYILTVYQIVPLLRMKKARNNGLLREQAMGIEEMPVPATPVKSRKGGATVIFIPLLYPLKDKPFIRFYSYAILSYGKF